MVNTKLIMLENVSTAIFFFSFLIFDFAKIVSNSNISPKLLYLFKLKPCGVSSYFMFIGFNWQLAVLQLFN